MPTNPTGATTPAVTPAEVIEEALASARLEGLEPSAETLADAQLVADGKYDLAHLQAYHRPCSATSTPGLARSGP